MLRNCNVCYYFWTIYHTSVVTVCCHVGTIFFFWKLISIPFPTKVLRMTRILKFFFPSIWQFIIFHFSLKVNFEKANLAMVLFSKLPFVWYISYRRSFHHCGNQGQRIPPSRHPSELKARDQSLSISSPSTFQE